MIEYTFARIEEGIVVEISKFKSQPEFHPKFEWIQLEADQTVKIGDRYKNNQFIDPPKNAIDYQAKLRRSDHRMARITEDLIDILVGKGIIDLDEFNSRVKKVLEGRKSDRDKLNNKVS